MALNSAHTWFFQSLSHEYPNRITVTLVEGIKLPDRQPVRVSDDSTLGPYYPVKVLAESRCISVLFEDVLSYQVVDESLAAPQSEIVSSEFAAPVQECSDLKYLRYVEEDSLIGQLRRGEYRAYYVWTEDQTFFVIASSPPEISLVDEGPDLSIERGESFSAS